MVWREVALRQSSATWSNGAYCSEKQAWKAQFQIMHLDKNVLST